MIVTIMGTESLGVRGLSCSVQLNGRKIVIDPGIALGWSRYGLLPHPFQIAIGAGVREKIIEELNDADDIIFSHFDGDHCPLSEPNPYQLATHEVKNSLSSCRIWAKGSNDSSPTQLRRRTELSEALGKDVRNAEGTREGPLEFSLAVPHGQQGERGSTVMMSRIEEGGTTFVHASDIQLLDGKTVETILDWKPDILLASGPPLYRYSASPSSQAQRQAAWENALELSRHVGALIVDHHLLRSTEGVAWLNGLKRTARGRVLCAADFMEREPLFLEAWRKELYEWIPVPGDWHSDYQKGRAGFDDYRMRGWEILIEKGRIRPCKWYYCCPVKGYTDAGKLERYWVENYCLVGNRTCVRYHLEEAGTYHPDNMLPNGEIRRDL